MNRNEFHQQYAQQAADEAQRLLAQKNELGSRWLTWVAGELYQLKPAEYAAMVRRELQRLQG